MEPKTKKKLHILLWCEAGVLLLLTAAAVLAIVLGPAPKPQLSDNTQEQTTQDTTSHTTGPTDAPVPPFDPNLPPNPFSQKDFVTENGFLRYQAGEAVLGIDVSTFQKNIDWAQVKAAGVEFVIIRLGHRGTNIGTLFVDDDAQSHYEGAIAAGLKVGGYYYSQAITPQEAKEEAELCLEIIQDWQVEMPIVFDWEHIDEDCRTVVIDPRTLTDCAKAFCQTIRDAGYDTMIYFNQRQAMNYAIEGWTIQDRYYLMELLDYGFWLAAYEEMDFPARIDMWQYTCTGKVPGINGNVDINLYFPNIRKTQ